jgi:hypothetical protein
LVRRAAETRAPGSYGAPPMSTVNPEQTEHAQRPKPTGATDAAWMVALILVFAVAVGYFFLNIIQFHLLPH